MAAIGQQTGTALIINERNSESGDYYRIENRLKTSANFSRETAALNEKSIGAIVFKKIKLEALIYVKFEIKDIK